MKNTELGRRIMDIHDCQPEKFNMDVWAKQTACGTAACLAGHAMLLSGYTWDAELGYFFRPDGSHVTDGFIPREARKLLGMTKEEELFGGSPTGLDDDGLADEIWYDWDDGPERFRKLLEESEGRA